MLAKHPLLMARVMMAMARQIVHLQETLESVVSRPVASRLASVILSMQDQADRTPEGLLLPATSHEDLGKMIGTTRESVSRTLAAWRRHGIVANRGRRLLIRKLQVLRDHDQPAA
jgi:CRP/FNR family transcriptional regulator